MRLSAAHRGIVIDVLKHFGHENSLSFSGLERDDKGYDTCSVSVGDRRLGKLYFSLAGLNDLQMSASLGAQIPNIQQLQVRLKGYIRVDAQVRISRMLHPVRPASPELDYVFTGLRSEYDHDPDTVVSVRGYDVDPKSVVLR